jgi:hypothetical protein
MPNMREDRQNHNHFLCRVCKDLSHARCIGTVNLKLIRADKPQDWTCHKCVLCELPFHTQSNLDTSDLSTSGDDHFIKTKS